MRIFFFTLALVLLVSHSKGQWLNKSQPTKKSIQRIKEFDATWFFMGENNIFKSNDIVNTINLCHQDSITFDDVMQNKDTFYIIGHWWNKSNYYYNSHRYVFKVFPGKANIDTNIQNIEDGISSGITQTFNFKDSVIVFKSVFYTKPNSYLYNLNVTLWRNEVLFKGSMGGNLYFSDDSIDFRNYFVRDSSLFLLCNFQPISPRNQTILVKRNLYRKVTDFQQFDSIMNLPRSKSIFMLNDSVGFIIGDTFIAKSTDYKNWDIKYQSGSCQFNQVWFTSKDTGYVVGSKNGKAIILKSMDGGIHWKEQACPVTATLNDIKFTKDGKVGIIVGDSGTVLRTINGGGTNFLGANASNENYSNLELYPNPASTDLEVFIHDKEVIDVKQHYCIKNNLGQILIEGSIDSQQFKIDISKLSNGIYFYQQEYAPGIKFIKL